MLILILISEQASAQWIPDGGMQSSFARQLDAVRWIYDTDVSWTDDQYYFQLENSFRSRLFISQGVAQNIQDENNFNFRSGIRFQNQFHALMEARSYRFTTTEIQQEAILGGIRYTPLDHLNLDLLAGGISDSRSGESDQGLLTAFRLQSGFRSIGNVEYQPLIRVELANISPRVQQNYGAEIRGNYNTNDVQIRGIASLGRAVRESYQPSSFFNRDVTDIIESIQSDTTFADVQSRFPVTDVVRGFLNVSTMNVIRSVESRRFGDDDQIDDTIIFDSRTNRNEFHIRTGFEFNMNIMSMTAGAELRYLDRTSALINTDDIPQTQLLQRSEQLLNSNFEQSRLELFTDNNFAFSQITSLDVRGRFGILRYDTPQINRDDRDEQNYFLQSVLQHAFSDYFNASLALTGEATHLVYLSAERSLQNNWRRSVRLRPGFQWSPTERLTIGQNFLVRANYTVQDFQLPGRPSSDQSSREFGLSMDVNYKLSSDWELDAGTSRNELRIGRLVWDSFQEIPTDTLVTWEGEFFVTRSTPKYRASVGAKYFLKRDFLVRTTVEATTIVDGVSTPMVRTGPGIQFTHQFGPALEVMVPFRSGNRIYINGWMQQQLVNRKLYVEYPEEFRSDFRRAEQRFQRRYFPNIELMVQLRI